MSKRHYVEMDYNEDSYSSDEVEFGDGGGPDILQHMEEAVTAVRQRPGRPRKNSTISRAGSIDAQLPINSSASLSGKSPPGQRRRGRGPSKRPCLNRNALMARENRQKKKHYIEHMEDSLKHFQDENHLQKETINKLQDTIKQLKQEVHYLHNVVSNEPEIKKLLRGINLHLGASISEDNDKSVPVQEKNDMQTTMNNGKSSLLDEAPAVATALSCGLTNASNTNNQSVPLSGSTIKDNTEVAKEDERWKSYEQNNPTPMATKTMSFPNFILTKTENPPSIGRSMEDDESIIVKKCSPGSNNSYCEYNTDMTGSVGIDNQLPTMPINTVSNPIGQGELTLSETDFSQISEFNTEDDLFDFQNNDVSNPLQFEPNVSDFIKDDDTFFNTMVHEINNGSSSDPDGIKEMCDSINYKQYFSALPNTGVCLHINSKKVTLEHCSICHVKNSEKSLKDILI